MPRQTAIANRLLRQLEPADFALIEPELVPFSAGIREVLIVPDMPILHSYFPDAGIASVVAQVADGSQAEVSIVGREGMVDVATVLGTSMTPLETFVQVPLRGHMLASAALRQAIWQSPTLRTTMLGFAQAILIQVSQTALASARHTIETRLARWLLMCHDRVDGDTIPMTHEFLSLMLSVRRAGVTVSLQALEARGLVDATRGLVTIRDRDGLRELAGNAYGVPEATYAAIFGSGAVGAKPAASVARAR